MSGSDTPERPSRNRRRQTITIRREDHIGDPIAVIWLTDADEDSIIERLRDYLGPRIRIVKAELSRDKVEVEVDNRGWRDEASRLASAARDLFTKGVKRNSLAMCREALELDPLSSGAMTLQGTILAALGRDKDALEAFKQARELGSTGIEVTLAMMQCAINLDRLGAAAAYAHEVLSIEPRNLTARRGLKAIQQGQER